jgi:dihydroorotate dehydrogenase electron transfer subunit
MIDSAMYSDRKRNPMRIDPGASITAKERWADYISLTFESPDIARQAAPGQFLMVKVAAGTHPLLRRPFSIHNRDGASLSLFFKITGEGTALLAEKKPGEILDILGPLGQGFDLALGAGNNRRTAVAPALAVGGGRGIAPLYFLAQELRAAGRPLKILYGGRTASDLPLGDKFKAAGFDLACSTDDGSFGFKGLVTDLLKNELNPAQPASVIYACGPEPMLPMIAGMAAAARVPAQLSLESHMGCGFGACWGCVKKIRRNGEESWVKVCEDGPVFPAEEVVWP